MNPNQYPGAKCSTYIKIIFGKTCPVHSCMHQKHSRYKRKHQIYICTCAGHEKHQHQPTPQCTITTVIPPVHIELENPADPYHVLIRIH